MRLPQAQSGEEKRRRARELTQNFSYMPTVRLPGSKRSSLTPYPCSRGMSGSSSTNISSLETSSMSFPLSPDACFAPQRQEAATASTRSRAKQGTLPIGSLICPPLLPPLLYRAKRGRVNDEEGEEEEKRTKGGRGSNSSLLCILLYVWYLFLLVLIVFIADKSTMGRSRHGDISMGSFYTGAQCRKANKRYDLGSSNSSLLVVAIIHFVFINKCMITYLNVIFYHLLIGILMIMMS